VDEYTGVIRVLNFIKEWIEMRRNELKQIVNDYPQPEKIQGKLEMLDEIEKVVENYRDEVKEEVEHIIEMLRTLVGDGNE